MIRLMVCIKQASGSGRVQIGAFEENPGGGTPEEQVMFRAVLRGLKIVVDQIAAISVSSSEIAVEDPHSELAEQIRAKFKP